MPKPYLNLGDIGFEVERQAKDMSDEERWRLRQEIAAPIAQKLHE